MGKRQRPPAEEINHYSKVKPPKQGKTDPGVDNPFNVHEPKKPMLKRLLAGKVVKTISGIIGGVVGGTGSLLGGLDPEFAWIVGVTAFIAIFMGMDKAERFYAIFKDRPKKEE